MAAFGSELVDELLQLTSSGLGVELTAQLGACAILRSVVLTTAGTSLLWQRCAVAPLTAGVVHTTAAINVETTTGQELLDQARLRLDAFAPSTRWLIQRAMSQHGQDRPVQGVFGLNSRVCGGGTRAACNEASWYS